MAPLAVLYAGDSVVAAHLGLASRRTLAWWFPVYDPTYAEFSPGLVMLVDLARTMGDHGLSVLDLGKGSEPYKDRLSNTAIEVLSGSMAQSRLSQSMYTARRWPGEQMMNMALESPQLRQLGRSTLRWTGHIRQRWVERQTS